MPLDMGSVDRRLVEELSMPCWYELGWVGDFPICGLFHYADAPAIVFRIRKEVVADRIAEMRSEGLFIPSAKQALRSIWQEFSPRVNSGFGFSGVLKYLGEAKDFMPFVAVLPVIRKVTDKKCPSCEGSGQNGDMGEDCLECKGRGKAIVMDWKEAEIIVATLSAVFRALELPPEKDLLSSAPQLLTALCGININPYIFDLCGAYGAPFVRWLGSRIKSMLEIEAAMKRAYDYMMGGPRRFDYNDFMVRVEGQNGWLNMNCPGQGCGLYPDLSGFGKYPGYNFSCHNVDNACQQLTLLAGLAALHDMARIEMSVEAVRV